MASWHATAERPWQPAATETTSTVLDLTATVVYVPPVETSGAEAVEKEAKEEE